MIAQRTSVRELFTSKYFNVAFHVSFVVVVVVFLNKIGVFWLKATIMNFRSFSLAMDVDFFGASSWWLEHLDQISTFW